MSHEVADPLPLKVVQHTLIHRALCEEGVVLSQVAKHHVSLLLVEGLQLKGDCDKVLMSWSSRLVLYPPPTAVVACLNHQMVWNPLHMHMNHQTETKLDDTLLYRLCVHVHTQVHIHASIYMYLCGFAGAERLFTLTDLPPIPTRTRWPSLFFTMKLPTP